ncbi:MAG: DUF6198 family protein [Hespellia sp.]|nr:DUF6198 family protein [Hespellia sp.]
MSKRELVKRYIVFLIGLFISSFGVSFVTKADLGTSPISSIPYVLSLGFKPTLGQFTIFFSLFLIALQVIILRKDFQKIQLLQIPVSILFGYFIDFSMIVLGWLRPEAYYFKIISLLVGCLILGIGVYFEVIADVIMLPGEAFVTAITRKFGTDFGTTKVCFDASMAIVAGILSFVLFHTLTGVREGTIIAALIVGMIARFLGKLLKPLTLLLFPAKADSTDTAVPAPGSAQPLVITIGREYGSGGREVGKAVAKKLGIPCYDDQLIFQVAQELGYSDEYVREHEQKLDHNILYSLYSQNCAYVNGEEGKYDALFHAEVKTIQAIAAKEPCVIIGRLGNFILEENHHAFHVFVTASAYAKVKRVMKRENISTGKEAENKIKKVETERKNYCKHFLGKEWGASSAYDLIIKTDLYGVENTADMILTAMEKIS